MDLEKLSKEEHQLLVDAKSMYGEYYFFAEFALDYMNSFFIKVDRRAVFFLLFFNQVMKHARLALLSAVRLHHVQANFDLRYAIEAGAWSAFAIAHYERGDYAELQEKNLIEPTKKIKQKMHKWLNENYPDGNTSLLRLKKQINELSSHANIVDAFRNFGGIDKDGVHVGFFDKKEDHYVKTDLWLVGNLIMGLLDLFYGVNGDSKVIELKTNFLDNMKKLKKWENKLKTKMQNHPRLVRFKN